MSTSNRRTYIQQMKRFSILALIGFVLLLFISFYFSSGSDSTFHIKRESDLPLDHVSPQELWMTRIENEAKLNDQRMKFLEEMLLANKKKELETDLENGQLKRELSNLKKEFKDLSDRPVAYEPVPAVSMTGPSDPFLSIGSPSPSFSPNRMPLIEVVMESGSEKVQHVDRVIPSGTSVKALLVSSVDIPCGVYGSSDPQPVKLRILDNGHLPKGVEARLKGGILIGSVYGDLSNERAYMRIERLTQVREDGNFVETEVTGYVTGDDGKYGVRGCVIDKSIKMVTNAALSGFFSGVSQYLQATTLSKTCGSYGPGCGVPGAPGPAGFFATSGQVAELAGTEGASNAFDMLTGYFIKRAEQVRPVIQITAGQTVDITFTHAAELGDLYTHNKVRAIRERNRCQR